MLDSDLYLQWTHLLQVMLLFSVTWESLLQHHLPPCPTLRNGIRGIQSEQANHVKNVNIQKVPQCVPIITALSWAGQMCCSSIICSSDSAKSTHNPYQVTGRKWNSLLSIHTYLEWKHIHYSVFWYTGVYKDSNLIRRARVWAEGLRVAIAFLQRMGMKYCNKEVTCQEKLQQLKVLILVRTRILFPATCHATDNHSHPSSMSKGVILSSDLHRQSSSNAQTYMQTYTLKHNLKYF